MKKIVTTVTAAAVIAAVLGGCGSKNATQGETGGKEISYWVAMDTNVSTRIKSYNEVSMYKQREKDSGVHINFIHPANGQEKEQFNLMIASRELPDIIEYNWSNYSGGIQKAIDDGVITSLNDYMQSAPNFKAALENKNELSEIYRKGSLTDKGD